ncbi:MAG: CbtB-domain containing protein [Rhizobiales bacterium]|nr:CbtB-domain containing protein [Hyphomicrobiales bacterium]
MSTNKIVQDNIVQESGFSIADLSAQERIGTGIITALFGTFMLYGVAFAHSDILHNAAHDTRHAITVPCH